MLEEIEKSITGSMFIFVSHKNDSVVLSTVYSLQNIVQVSHNQKWYISYAHFIQPNL